MADERVVLVTGGAKGIGLACARRFARQKAKVIIADSDEKAGQAAMDDLDAKHGDVLFVPCDVSDLLSVRNLFAQIRSNFGRLDVLVNNAGVVMAGNILTLELEDYDRVMSINLRGSFLVAREAARQMVAQIEDEQDSNRERLAKYAIINMSSVNAVMAIPDQLAYVTTKGGLNQMTKAMALALAEHGIRVNAVGPGSINTDVLKAVADNPVAKQKILTRTPLGHIAEPDEIAGIVQFLASPDASYMTGQCLYADGGRLALNYTVTPA
ncbi:3-oxoacyl-[acyl-carrier protein] reductase [hydrothermal vent metagenome]|uniref:3-oxoacyl-[acyl-carrier protein] reductase n=1 Tax=hydrothermal vent metagenome TaxID=652676 RepID=A0A3B0RSF5_9ZZZZ